ncbi:MAG: CPBP family intramembrane glutamic endopeptidase [Eubacteriales bacterium]
MIENTNPLSEAPYLHVSDTPGKGQSGGKLIYNYQPKKAWPAVGLLACQLVLPFVLVATVQSIAYMAAFVFYLRSDAVAGFMDKLTGITSPSASGSVTFDSSMFDSIMKMLMGVMSTKPFLIAMTAGYLIIIGVYLLIVRVIEKRSTQTMGLPFHEAGDKRRAVFSYTRGLGIGLCMMLAVFLLLLVTGQARVAGFGLDASAVSLFVLYIFMWIPQGASEEIMTRGYMLPRLSAKFSRPAAVAVTSLFFGLLHTGNSGFSIIAFINLILIAVFFAMFSIYTQEIWTVCAVHSVWNFAQGNLFGFEVSGIVPTASLFQTESIKTGSDILTGGDFGPEGGLIVSGVIVFSLIILVLIHQKRRAKKWTKTQ